jgi:dipeptidyl aminopeptidase/acylaminoacyl peptidase
MKKLILGFLLLSASIFAQEKKALTPDDFAQWQKIESPQISRLGNIVTYAIKAQEDDGAVEIYNRKTVKKETFERGTKPKVSYNEKYVSFLVKPQFQKIRVEKKAKKKKLKLSQDSLKVYDVAKGTIVFQSARIKEFALPEEADGYIAFKKIPKKENKKDKYKTFELGVFNFAKSDTLNIEYVTEYAFNKKGTSLFVVKQGVDSLVKSGVYKINLANFKEAVVDTSATLYSKLAIFNSAKFSYLVSDDSLKAENKKYRLVLKNNSTTTILDSTKVSEGWKISQYQKPQFSDNGLRLFFGLQIDKPFIAKDTTLLDEEKAQVDVWSWTDKQIQPEQKVNKKRIKEKSFLAVYHIANKKVVQLANEKVDRVLLDKKKNLLTAMGLGNDDYKLSRSWDYPWKRDLYSIDLNTGAKKLLVKGIADGAKLSPKGNFATYYSRVDSSWYNADLKNDKLYKLTKNTTDSKFYDDENDIPSLPSAVGSAFWSEDEKFLVINDKYDFWKIKPKGSRKNTNITNGFGFENKIQFRYNAVNKKEEYLTVGSNLVLKAFNEKTKDAGFYQADFRKSNPIKILEESVVVSRLTKAENANSYIYMKESFYDSPNLFVTNGSNWKAKQVSDTNPQQKDYKWGTVDLISWKSYAGKDLEGLMYYPENFDSTKKYPVIIYFYEIYSNRMNKYYAPSPSRSIVNFTYLTSNDYLVFVPDIKYIEGQPGQDAYDAIMAGVDKIEEYSFVDSENMAIQGQSWGGYQVAYLVTQTNRFKCAMAGAPVSNMTSAYGGIRWASGLSREFQYERTQSRLGKDLWSGFDRYIANSPVFMAPKVETPLLMMHNDNDGAVPYYQGIEYFMALRRLQKPVWLLVYNKESHNLKYRKNMKDLTVRMYQFFDYYLKGKPAPKWLIDGVPYIDKGRDYGLELKE